MKTISQFETLKKWRSAAYLDQWVKTTYHDAEVVGRVLATFEGASGATQFDVEVPLKAVRLARGSNEIELLSSGAPDRPLESSGE